MSNVLALLPVFVGLYFCTRGARGLYRLFAEPQRQDQIIEVLKILLGIGLMLAPFAR